MAIFHRIVLKKMFEKVDNKFFNYIIKKMRRNIPEQDDNQIDEVQLFIDIEDVLNKHQLSVQDFLNIMHKETKPI